MKNIVIHNKKYIAITFIILITQFIITIITIPIVEFPDAAYHINKIYANNSKIYYKIQHFFLLGDNIVTSLVSNSKFFFAGNTSFYLIKNHNYPFLVINQIINICFIFITIIILNFQIHKSKSIYLIKICDKNTFFKASLIFYIWPQINYYLTTVSSDLFVILFQPFFILFLLERKNVLNFILSIILSLFIDRNAFTNVIFLIVYICITSVFYRKEQNNPKKTFVLIISFLFFFLVYFAINSPLLKILSNSIYSDKMYAETISKGNILIKLGATFLSSLYLTGSMSFTTFYIIYAIYFVIILSIVLYVFRNRNSKFLFIALLSSLLTILLTLTIIPTLGQIKYYTYTILFIIFGIFVLMKRNINFKIFSILSISLFFIYCFSSIKAFINIYLL